MVTTGRDRRITRASPWALVLVTSCAPTLKPLPVASPCADSTYLALKRIPVDSLTVRQYETFRTRDDACVSAHAQAETARAVEHGGNQIAGAIILVLLTGLTIMFIAANN